MNQKRRFFLAWLTGLFAAPLTSWGNDKEILDLSKGESMYGLIRKIIATNGNRDKLAAIMMDGISGLPGCLSYIVAQDGQNENALWITEVWESQDRHRASLSLEPVQRAIKLGKPLIDSFAERHETTPLGGHGISTP